MLFDPKWEIKVDPFSLESLIAWLEKQPADVPYDYCDPFNCLLCQYFRASGLKLHSVALNTLYPDEGSVGQDFPKVLKSVSQGEDHMQGWTFGAALDRARATLTSPT